MEHYTAPIVTDLGSFADLTLSTGGVIVTVTKTGGTSDVIVIAGGTDSAPGDRVLSLS